MIAAAIKALDGLTRLGAIMAAIALAVTVAAYAYEVVARYVFDAPTWWSAELVAYLLCVTTFCMLPRVTQTKGQVAVTVLLERLPHGARSLADRCIWFLGFGATAAVTWFAAEETARQFSRSVQMMAAYPIPKWWVSIWIAFGFGLTALQFLRLALARQQPPDTTTAASGRL
ncbi:MAG: TRAP transporter small permease [Minwuia sp.]|nr:TRAP transporter small permease [Minwuia sp.]